MAINPCTLAVLSSADVALFERVLAKADRWFSTSTQTSNQPPKSIQCVPDTNARGIGTLAVSYNLNRIGTLIFVPAAANNLYMNFTQSFGVVSGSVPQYGMFLLANAYIVFGPEYCGDLYFLNAASSGVTLAVPVLELLRDDSVW